MVSKIFRKINFTNIKKFKQTIHNFLRKFHTHLLKYDGEGGYKFTQMDTNVNQRLSFADEKDEVERRLREVPVLKKRLKELCKALDEENNSDSSETLTVE